MLAKLVILYENCLTESEYRDMKNMHCKIGGLKTLCN